MEWVETTGRTLEEAREAALDQLGVDDTDAEFEVLEQPRPGLFGRMRGEARVRARVKPTAPRAKEDRRDRRRRSKAGTEGKQGAPSDPPSAETPAPAARDTRRAAEGGNGRRTSSTASGGEPGEVEGAVVAPGTGAGPGDPESRRRRRRRSGGGGSSNAGSSNAGGGTTELVGAAQRRPAERSSTRSEHEDSHRRDGAEVEVPLQEQGRIAEDFLSGLITEFGLSARVTLNEREEENLDLALAGNDLGLLIGQKGTTLLAIQDLTRTVVQHKTGATNGRIHVDIGGYRQKRSEALAKFALEIAAQVKQSGQRAALEPMSAADRKVVHDALTDVDGVATVSEGEDPRRRVVVVPSE